MDVLQLSKASSNECSRHQTHNREPRNENFDDLPKCFRAIAALRQNVNTKRVLAGDTRFALWRSLDELLDAAHERLQDTQEDVVASKARFEKLLTDFDSSRDRYEKADTELGALDDRLAEEEKRLYGHLETANVPVPSIYNYSFPLRSLPDQPPSRDDLTYGESSEDGTDPFESKYGLGTSVGNYPRLRTETLQNAFSGRSPSISDEDKIELDIPIAEPLRDKGISRLMEQNGFFPDLHHSGSPLATEYPVDESSVLFGTTPDPHLLILDCRSPVRLRRYVLEFDSKMDRVNKWLLHNLRISPLEIERLRNSYDDDSGSTTMDEETWAKHVLELWSQGNYPVALELDSQPERPFTSDPADSLKQNLESRISNQLNREGFSHDDLSRQYQNPESWLHISRPRDHEISLETLPFAKVNHESAVTHSFPPRRVSEYDQWSENVLKPQALLTRIQLMCRGTFRSLTGPLRMKCMKPMGQLCRNIKTRPVNGPGHDETPRRKVRVDSVSPLGETKDTQRRVYTSPLDHTVSSNGTSRPKRIDSEPTRKDSKQYAKVDLTSRPILKTLHTKLLSVGQVFLVSIDSVVDSNPMESRLPLIFKEIYPSIISLITIQPDSRFGFLTACPVLKDGNQKLNLFHNEHGDFVVCSDVPEYNSETKIHVRLTDHAYIFPFEEQLRLNSAVELRIPLNVPTLAIGYTYPYDIQKIFHDPKFPQKNGNYLPRKLLAALRRAGSGELYSNNKEYASSETYVEPESFWDSISTDPFMLDYTQTPHYSAVV